MTENVLPLDVASVTDRGLNERRPHNEDSMLAEPDRGLFVVADGVGGAEAGEVASQTTVEVIGEAFRQRAEGDDVEDLLEIAIQRANDIVYRQSREQPHLAMMATTVVALHIQGLRATVGHVGDSRLYRLAPDGTLLRETEDHSVVEEEVRAGRMTAAQAANHPGRNVISRAVGAEPSVEVDLKTFEYEPGTVFILCSDGITRHVPDEELSSVVGGARSLDDACEELKRLCYERGAEDNLTAVLVRAGAGTGIAAGAGEEPTLIRERKAAGTAAADGASLLRRPFDDVGRRSAETSVTRTRTADPRPSREAAGSPKGPGGRTGSGAAAIAAGVLVLIAVVTAASFVGGRLYERKSTGERATAAAADLSREGEGEVMRPHEVGFEERKRAVDLSPRAEAERMLAESNNDPLSSTDPEFLYLYGRAMLLEDRQPEAARAFGLAIERINENMTPRNGQLKIDARLATIAAHLRAGDPEAASAAAAALDDVIRGDERQPTAAGNEPASPDVTP